jgi:hypothetical protein
MKPTLEAVFPGLAGKPYRITSPHDEVYNCIAWAVGISNDWWWPDESGKGYWPIGIPREVSIDAFRHMLSSLGFEPCPDADLEPGFEKVALFTNDAGVPKHAARQLGTGFWTSKLGNMEDIEHDLRDLEGTIYGMVALVMRRKKE